MVGHHLVDAGVVAGDIFSKLAKDYRYLSIIDLQSLVYVEKELKKRDEMEGMEKELKRQRRLIEIYRRTCMRVIRQSRERQMKERLRQIE